ncbi:MAG TPA: MFS transporter [Ktedonobacteraceae bacterium]|nr:MFS transporter [Ktedonobacteraceae bacterium]
MKTRTLKPTSPDRTDQHSPSRLSTALLVAGIVLLAANLRPAITSVGPLIGEIRADIGISNGLIGLLTALPLLAFAALSPLAPRLARRWGMEFTLLVSLIVLVVGIVLRSLPSVVALFAGTALLGTAIAISNVLLPSLMKRDFPTRVGLMTSVYSTIMGSWAALAAGVSVPIAQGLGIGWRGSLACWALLAIVAIVVWLPQLRSHHAIAPKRTSTTVRGLWRSLLAWQVTLFMGFQSLVFYAVVTWLSAILHDQGMNATSAGWMVSLFQLVGIPSSFLVPMLAGRRPSQRLLVVAIGILCLTAYAGLLSTGNNLIPLWIALLGFGQGACISLALMFFILRTPDAAHAAELSGMAQSIGYLLAAAGPVLFGLLHDLTHTWTIPLLTLVAVTLGMLCTGLGAGRNATVTP